MNEISLFHLYASESCCWGQVYWNVLSINLTSTSRKESRTGSACVELINQFYLPDTSENIMIPGLFSVCSVNWNSSVLHPIHFTFLHSSFANNCQGDSNFSQLLLIRKWTKRNCVIIFSGRQLAVLEAGRSRISPWRIAQSSTEVSRRKQELGRTRFELVDSWPWRQID